MRSEYATLWLPAQGRHPRCCLPPGSTTPACWTSPRRRPRSGSGRSRASTPWRSARSSTRPWTCGTRCARPAVRTSSWCRSGPGRPPSARWRWSTGSGDTLTFRAADVQILETIAAHAAVAVENSRLVERLRYDAYHDRLTSLPNRRRITVCTRRVGQGPRARRGRRRPALRRGRVA
jgi:hypothetical protein